ncbi:MAG: IS200/IS605 family transposase [Verrucomicrobia bacterium]|nr:IS200/IS605 family transposase [Verrucomicrobiota bacterium]
MASTFHCLHYHVVFSTKNRIPWLVDPDVRERVWAFMGGIANENGSKPLIIGGIADHVHLLLQIPPRLAVSDVVKQIKGGSSRWIHDTFPSLKDFAWQDGFAIFAVSKSGLDVVIRYISRQEEHHDIGAFQDELRTLLERHEVPWDERYLLG